MHILVVHNRYRSTIPSGENTVVDNEIGGLEHAGHRVSTYIRSSDELADMSALRKLSLASSPIHSPSAVADIESILNADRPDLMHLHNPYPLISMSVVRAAHRMAVPVVHTVHNHRHTCIKGTYQRDASDCRDCLTAGHPGPGLVHACYRESYAQSALMAAALMRHRSTYGLITRFIALSPDVAASLKASGFPASKISLKPNSVPDPGPTRPLGEGFAYVGRLSQEKGVLALLEAWCRFPEGRSGTLRMAGDGPERSAVERVAARRADVQYLGQLDGAGVRDLLAETSVVVVPSLWAEAFPLVLLEAMAAGRPLLVTNQGGLPHVVDEQIGRVVAADVNGLASGLAELTANRSTLEVLGLAARDRYDSTYHPTAVTGDLLDIYAEAISTSR